jgi:hypothetical protein
LWRPSLSSVVEGFICATIGSVISTLVIPKAFILSSRALISVFECLEYFALRRYRREPLDPGPDPASLLPEEHQADMERLHEENARSVLRAVAYRGISTVAVTAAVVHPLRQLAALYYNRAVMHYCGLLIPDEAARGTASLGSTPFTPLLIIDLLPLAFRAFECLVKTVTGETAAVWATVARVANDGCAHHSQRAERPLAGTSGTTEYRSAEEALHLLWYRCRLFLPLLAGFQLTVVQTVASFFFGVYCRLGLKLLPDCWVDWG